MSVKNKKLAPSILLIQKNTKDAKLITEWLNEFGQTIRISDKSNVTETLNKQKWNLIVIDMNLDAVEKKGILKIINLASSKVLILTTPPKNKDNYFLKTELTQNFGVLFKPFDKTTFVDTILNLGGSSLDRRRNNRRKKGKKVVLFIGAHPDDVEIGSAGCIARHYSQGDSINILTLSSGESGGNFKVRREESKKAAQVLHANLFLKELADTQISSSHTIHIINEIVQEIKPTHVYTHSAHDAHQDHRNVHDASIVACRTVPNLYCYQSPSSTIYFKPSLFVEISKYIEQKLFALSIYKSQASKRPYLQEDMIRATARYWGRYANYGLVEPMEVIRQTEILF